MQHKYKRDYDYSEQFASVRVSMEQKLRLKTYAESLCDANTGFVSMKEVLDKFLDGNTAVIEGYIKWLKTQG